MLSRAPSGENPFHLMPWLRVLSKEPMRSASSRALISSYFFLCSGESASYVTGLGAGFWFSGPVIVAVDVVAEKSPTGRARMCCRSKPTGEQRQATRRAACRGGAGRPCSLVDVPQFSHAPGGFMESRACHLTYTRSGGCERAPNSFLCTKTRVNISPIRDRLIGTTLASALKSRSSPGVRLDLIISRYDKISK